MRELELRRPDASRMQRTKPPFRADHVGSLLRSAALKEARAQARAGRDHAPTQLKAIEDREIEALIKKQEAVGLKSITDGEYRRASWQTRFPGRARRRRVLSSASASSSSRARSRSRSCCASTSKLGGYAPHPMIEHFKFVQAHTKQTPKMTIPSPSTLHFRYGREAVPETIYPSMDDFYRDLGTTLSQGGARLRRRRLPLSAARRGQPHLSLRSRAARAGQPRAATIPTSCRTSMPT